MKIWQVVTVVALAALALCVCSLAALLLFSPTPPLPTLPLLSPTFTMTHVPTLTPTSRPTRTPTPGLGQEEIEYLEVVQEALDAANLTWENMRRLLAQLRDDFDYWIADPDWRLEMAVNLLVPSVYYVELRDNVNIPAAFVDAHQDLVTGFEHWDKAARLILDGVALWMQGEDDQGKVASAALEIEQGQEAVLLGTEKIEAVKATY